MFVDRLLNQGCAPALEGLVRFTARRQTLLAENVVNASTPGYIQKDLSLEKFQAMLAERLDRREAGASSFDEIAAEVEHPTQGILFHDGNNRSMEQLMTDQAKNALMHNLAIELLRKQFQSLEMALKERVI